MPMVTYLFIVKSALKRGVIDNEHNHHGRLRKDSVCETSKGRVLDHAVLARVVHKNTTPGTH